MIIFKTHYTLSAHLISLKKKEKKIVLVPTMGALHQGHLSLLKQVNDEDAVIVSSIFVNPTQFNDLNDFAKYPATIESDIFKLEKSGTNILFLPSVEEIYPNGTTQKQHFDIGYLEKILEGTSRPGHFQGVCQVIERLIQIIQPNILVLGQKDYQQCMVITQLLKIIGKSINVIICSTIRESDGLAMSSRNLRLSVTDREKAPLIYKTMLQIKEQIMVKNFAEIKVNASNALTTAGFTVDYIEIASAENLQSLQEFKSSNKMVILIAASINGVRLIDNLFV